LTSVISKATRAFSQRLYKSRKRKNPSSEKK
jgi:hypothetical protein